VNTRVLIRAEREQTIKDHDDDGDGCCRICGDEYPCQVRLVAERAADALDNRSRKRPTRTEET
jgi:hypothetical protein